MADSNPVEEARGKIEIVDVPCRALTIRVNGVATIFDVGPDCVLALRGERVKLRLLQPSDMAQVLYLRTPEGLKAQSVDVSSRYARTADGARGLQPTLPS